MSKIDLAAKTKAELLKAAQRLGLRGISTMNKDELVAAIRHAQQRTRAPRRQPLAVATVAKKVADEIKRRAVRKRESADAAAAAESKPVAPRRAAVAQSKKEQAASLAAAAQ